MAGLTAMGPKHVEKIRVLHGRVVPCERTMISTRPNLLFVALSALALGLGACRTPGASGAPAQARRFERPPLEDVPGKEALRRFIQRRSEAGHPNHFCAVRERARDEAPAVTWLHWREGNRLIDFEKPVEGAADPEEQLLALRRSSALDLSKDVVETEAQIGSSTYLVTRAWVDEILGACVRQGVEVVLETSP